MVRNQLYQCGCQDIQERDNEREIGFNGLMKPESEELSPKLDISTLREQLHELSDTKGVSSPNLPQPDPPNTIQGVTARKKTRRDIYI